jgi:hypothetical protein
LIQAVNGIKSEISLTFHFPKTSLPLDIIQTLIYIMASQAQIPQFDAASKVSQHGGFLSIKAD